MTVGMRDIQKEKGDKYADYLTIGELADALNRGVRCVQKWEQKGYIKPPKARSKNNWRLYSPDEVKEIKRRAKMIRVGRYRSDRHPSTWWDKDKKKKASTKSKKSP